MRRILRPVPILAALLAGAVPATAATVDLGRVDVREPVSRTDVAALRGDVVPGEAIVRFERGTSPSERLAARRAAGVELDSALPIARAQVVEVDGGVAAAVKRLERQPDVAYAQPNYRYHALAPEPDDTFFDDLWGLQDTPAPNPGVDVLPAWDTTRGSGQVVAVVDTGVALDHPDLAANLVAGFDFVDNDAVADDYNFHGTHVAGTVAAIDDNSLGTAGVAPDAQVMPVRALDGNGSGSSDDIAAGIAFAAQNGADVINLSLGGPADAGDQLMSDAVTLADGLDVVVVAAAGNETNDNDVAPTTPCTLPQANLICVAAVNQSGGLAGFSNFGRTSVDVGAPGTNILSAEADYDAVFTNGLDAPAGWLTGVANGGVLWGFVSSPKSEGSASAADSPSGTYGQAIDPDFFAQSVLIRQTGISLAGQTGCRMHFDLRRQLESDFDFLLAGATDDVDEDGLLFSGSSNGSFFAEEVSISSFDGQTGVKPEFVLLSDGSIELDGVYVDDLEILCRASTYSNAAPPAGNYVAFQGTSMAAPHVAGVAALVRAADPAAPDTEVVQAIEASVLPLASLTCKVVTGGTVDAPAAIATALALPGTPAPVSDPCPDPPPGTPPPSGGGNPAGGTTTSPASTPPAPPTGLKGGIIRVSRKGVLSYSFRATPGLFGEAVFRTRRKAVVSRRAHVRIGSRAFKVPSSGRVTVKVKLSRKNLRILRRNRRLRLNAIVTVRNTANLSSKATKAFTLRPPRR
jgi:thermitase